MKYSQIRKLYWLRLSMFIITMMTYESRAHQVVKQNNDLDMKIPDWANKLCCNISILYPVNYLGDVGTKLTVDNDLSLGYHMPWYNDENFITVHLKPYFYLASSVHIMLHLYIIRAHFYIELIGSKMTVLDSMLKIDMKNFRDFGGSLSSKHENLLMTVNF